MKNIVTWLGTGVLVAMATAAGCSVEVTSGNAAGSGGSTGATGGTGGSTGGTGGTTGGTAGTSGTGGASGSSGAAGSDTDGGSADASFDGPMICAASTTDGNCKKCAFEQCKTEHCACVADTVGCGADVEAYYKCLSAPGADADACALDFFSDMNRSEAGASLANDLATCIDTTCIDRCAAIVDGGSSG